MSANSPRRMTIAATVGLLVVAGTTVGATVVGTGPGASDASTAVLAPAQPADTDPAVAPMPIPETEAIVITDPDGPASSPAPTVAPDGFADGRQASEAAEALLAGYLETEFGASVSDPACSVPESGDVGATFVCYGLQQGDLVIVVRATIHEQRLITIDLIVDQAAPPDTDVDTDDTSPDDA